MAATILNLDSELSRKGARACLQALRDMEAAAELTNTPGKTWERQWLDKQAARNILMKAAGDMPPFLIGFVLALAEYVDASNTSGQPSLDAGGWTPEASMSAAEVAAYRRDTQESFERFERELGE